MSDARTDRRSCADMWLKQLQDSNDVSCLGIYTPPEHNTCISIATPRCRFVEEVSSTSIDHAPGLSSARLHVWSGCVAFYPALDGDIWWLRLLSTQQPTTRVVLQALAPTMRAKEAPLAGDLALPLVLGVRNAACQAKA